MDTKYPLRKVPHARCHTRFSSSGQSHDVDESPRNGNACRVSQMRLY